MRGRLGRRSTAAVCAATWIGLLGAGEASGQVIFSSDDRTGSDFAPFDGVFTMFQGGTGGQLLAADFSLVGEEQRFALEFDISNLTTVTSALLRVWEISDDQVDASLYGYAGNGFVELMDLDDANLTNLLVSDVDDGIVGGFTPVDLDVTPFVQSLVAGGEDFAGFVAMHNNSGASGLDFPRWRLYTSNDDDVGGMDLRPRLIVVPEPSFVVLMAGGVAALWPLARRRRRQRQRGPGRVPELVCG